MAVLPPSACKHMIHSTLLFCLKPHAYMLTNCRQRPLCCLVEPACPPHLLALLHLASPSASSQCQEKARLIPLRGQQQDLPPRLGAAQALTSAWQYSSR
jgi:hypothetical protein